MSMNHEWTCGCCGRVFDNLPMGYSVSAPRNWFGVPEDERPARAFLNDDICVIDNREFYVRGCIEVPVKGSAEPFVWGVWVSVSETSFKRILELWDADNVDDEPDKFGWLCTWITGYPEPPDVKCSVKLRSGNQRPSITLEPTEYPLAVEQHHGITLDRVKEIAGASGHAPSSS